MELVKACIASIPLAIALLIAYVGRGILALSKQMTRFGVFLHEKMSTKLGKEISSKREQIEKAIELYKEKMQAASGGEPGENALRNIIRSNNAEGSGGGNVFVLGKKDDGNKN